MAEMEDESWLCDLAFLVDITTCMNELSTRLQQKAQYVSEMYGHIKGFMNKLRLWHAHIQNANLSHFPTLKKWECAWRRLNLQINLKNCLMNFQLASKISDPLYEIFSSPLHTDIDKNPTNIQIELIDLQERTDLKTKYVEMNLGDFY